MQQYTQSRFVIELASTTVIFDEDSKLTPTEILSNSPKEQMLPTVLHFKYTTIRGTVQVQQKSRALKWKELKNNVLAI